MKKNKKTQKKQKQHKYIKGNIWKERLQMQIYET